MGSKFDDFPFCKPYNGRGLVGHLKGIPKTKVFTSGLNFAGHLVGKDGG